MKETFARIAGENRTYTGREYFGLDQGYYLSKMRVNEEVAVSGLVIQDERSNILTSQYIGSGVTTLKAGQVITFKRPVYRVYAATGSFTFFLTPTQRYGVSSPPTAKESYFDSFPAWLPFKYSLAFDAEKAEDLSDYTTNTLYFRDSNFDRVAATFSRTSSATRVNKQGLIETVATGIPRIDYTDGTAKLLMEPARTNQALRSEDLTTSWTPISCSVTANAAIAPDGNLTADAVIPVAGTTTNNYVQQSQTILNSTAYTFSFYAKSAGYRYVTTFASNFIPTSIIFDLQDVTVVSGTNATITDVGNGWRRITVTKTTTGTSTFIRMYSSNSSTATSYTSDGVSGTYFWGAQLEVGAYPTSYIPTAGSTVTRNADSATVSGIGAKIGQSEGSLYVNGLAFSAAQEPSFSFADVTGSLTNRIAYRVIGGGNRASVFLNTSAGNGVAFDSPISSIFANTFYKTAFRYAVNDFAFYKDGASLGTDTDLATFSGQLVDFKFARQNDASPFYGKVNQLMIFPTALTNSELQQLTT